MAVATKVRNMNRPALYEVPVTSKIQGESFTKPPSAVIATLSVTHKLPSQILMRQRELEPASAETKRYAKISRRSLIEQCSFRGLFLI
ncbi:hypothetical protein HHI36_020444 [Cryptolaemus montrouzieri]|uniref:Uncharacterized protein n=1 Tax=Cryptolaemus montrouzieri TaxID=559131 RepID=A0ABD2NAQ9_9CUCU